METFKHSDSMNMQSSSSPNLDEFWLLKWSGWYENSKEDFKELDMSFEELDMSFGPDFDYIEVESDAELAIDIDTIDFE